MKYALHFLSYTAVLRKEKQSQGGSQQSVATVQPLETFTNEPLSLAILTVHPPHIWKSQNQPTLYSFFHCKKS